METEFTGEEFEEKARKLASAGYDITFSVTPKIIEMELRDQEEVIKKYTAQPHALYPEEYLLSGMIYLLDLAIERLLK